MPFQAFLTLLSTHLTPWPGRINHAMLKIIDHPIVCVYITRILKLIFDWCRQDQELNLIFFETDKNGKWSKKRQIWNMENTCKYRILWFKLAEFRQISEKNHHCNWSNWQHITIKKNCVSFEDYFIMELCCFNKINTNCKCLSWKKTWRKFNLAHVVSIKFYQILCIFYTLRMIYFQNTCLV